MERESEKKSDQDKKAKPSDTQESIDTGKSKDLKEKAAVSSDSTKEPPTLSAAVLKEPPTLSAAVLKEPPTLSAAVLKEPPTVSTAVRKDPPTVSTLVLKDPPTESAAIRKDPPTVSTAVPKRPTTTLDVKIELPPESKLVTKEPSCAGAVMTGDIQLERIHFQDVHDVVEKREKGITKDSGPDDLYLSSYMKEIRERRVFEYGELATLGKHVPAITEDGSEPTTMAYLPQETYSDDSPDSSPDIELEAKSLKSDKDIEEIKDKIDLNQTLINQTKEAIEIMMELEAKGASVLEAMDGDVFHSCRSLLMYIDMHIGKVEAIAKRMVIQYADTESTNLVSLLPWGGIRTLRRLIIDVSTKEAISVLSEEIKATINKDTVLDTYQAFRIRWRLVCKNINAIREMLFDFKDQAVYYQQRCNEFRPHLRTGDTEAAKTMEEQLDLHKWLADMAFDCYDYVTVGIRETLNVVDKLDAFVKENRILYGEMRAFLRCEMNLFDPVESEES